MPSPRRGTLHAMVAVAPFVNLYMVVDAGQAQGCTTSPPAALARALRFLRVTRVVAAGGPTQCHAARPRPSLPSPSPDKCDRRRAFLLSLLA
ncbi:hypothetical protein MTO96_012905 [Rhipicephalus appendiculatus]